MLRRSFCKIPAVIIVVLLTATPVMAEKCRCVKCTAAGGSSNEAGSEGQKGAKAESGEFGPDDLGTKDGTKNAVGNGKDKKLDEKPEPAKAESPKSPQSSLAAVREKSLRAAADNLGFDYDTMLGELAEAEQPDADGVSPDDGADKPDFEDVDRKEAAVQRRRDRLRKLARHVLGAATSPELQALVTTLAPDPRVDLAFGILNRVGTIVKGSGAEAASEGGLDDAHDLAKENRAEFAAAFEDVLSIEQEEKQLQLLLAKQAAERELFLNQQAVARAEKGLQRARDAAAASQKELESAEKARN
jgi:hypothetical protein